MQSKWIMIPSNPQNTGSNKMTGTKQISCLHAPRIKPVRLFKGARNREEYTV